MGVIVPNNENNGKAKIKKKYLLLLALLLLLFNLVFFIWYFTTEKKKYFNDKDGDGYGNIDDYKDAKIRPWGFVDDHSDTDDNNPCIPDSTTQACIKIKEPINPPSPTNGTGNSITGSGTSNSTGNGTTVPGAGPTTGPGNFSCPTLSKNIGDTCSDGDPDTVDDKVNNSCICVGKSDPTPPKDDDGDGVDDKSDKCPKRFSKSKNGCPNYQISSPTEAFIGDNFDVKIAGDKLESGDKVNWIVSSDIKQISSGIELEASGQIVGLYKISAEISNPNGFDMPIEPKSIGIRIKPNVLADMFKPFFVYGSISTKNAPNQSVLKAKSDQAKAIIKQYIKDGILSSATVYDKSGGVVNDLETYINADIIGGAVSGPCKIKNIKYSNITGKITEIHLY